MKFQINDRERFLLEKVAQGDTQAFSQLFYAYHQELASYIVRLVRSTELAEEIVQDTFLKIWLQRNSLNQIENFRAYLFTISRNHTFNVMRLEARKTLQYQTWLTNQTDFETEETIDLENKYSLLDEAIAQLPPQQQKVWILSRKDGLKHEEIAKLLSLSKETVKRHISLATASIMQFVKRKSHTLCIIIFVFCKTILTGEYSV